MTAGGPLPRTIVASIDASKILGIRADDDPDHRFTGVWPIVIGDRVYVRSWTQKSDGWFTAVARNPLATLQVGDRTVRVRAVRVRSERVRDAMDAAYAAKYPTPGSRKYVVGFRTEKRRGGTIEFRRR